jgi:hypothetical protein
VRRRVLLDENVPHQLRPFLSDHDAQTASYAGFAGLKNGALLKAATEAKFEVMVTADKTIQDEQNMAGRTIALVSLSANSWRIIRNHVSAIALAVDAAAPGSFTRVECGNFGRSTKPQNPSLG